ncbi:MAG: GNAT family N-acetyltransferase [Candidatus Gottesmanbacteria bacterium]
MITITKATEKDVLLEEWHQVDKPHYGKSVEWNEKKFRFKATEDGTLIGTVGGKHESGVIYIDALMTAKNARGRGVGTKLIEKAEKFGKKLGAHRTWLVTGKDWSENTFYKKLGFELIGNLPDFYFHKDFVIYTRRIK